MAGFSEWIKTTFVSIVDPEREKRIAPIVKRIHQGLRKDRQQFQLEAALRGLPHSSSDLSEARSRVYRSILERGWTDGKLSAKEQETLQWVAKVLKINRKRATELNYAFARERFATAFAEAMEDGKLDRDEMSKLHEIATSVGSTLPQFVRQFFLKEGESFLRGMFIAFSSDGRLTEREWNSLVTTACRIGFSTDEITSLVGAQAQSFVEHVMADAKADGRLTRNEESTIVWLLDNLRASPEFETYVRGELSFLRQVTDISDGRLPSIQPPGGFGLRSGEIVHLHEPALWRQVRNLKSGQRTDEHRGTLTLTDNRLLFSSPSKSQTLNLRRIVASDGSQRHITVQPAGKPAWTFYLSGENTLSWIVFRTAVEMANQTVTTKLDGTPSRRIPRDVRQRVWQRYGGQCADCGAKEYLEFDHVIPVAKGGSNSDNNIQLLCRRCNLTKSDHI